MPDFGARLEAVFATKGRLCVGIDPHAFLLEQWGLPDNADGVRDFGLRVVDAAADLVGILKPQVAFFERHGSAGYAALEDVLAAARGAGMLLIGDAKRGDVGSSVEAYGQAWLTPGSPLEVDAVTLAAYQGLGSIAAPLALALANGKGVFVLAATSNPEAIAIQTAVLAQGQFRGRTVAGGIVAEVNTLNAAASSLGSLGVVLGATVDLADHRIGPGELARTPILAPGFGEQGAAFSELADIFGVVSPNVIVSISRSVLRAGPDGLAAEIDQKVAELA